MSYYLSYHFYLLRAERGSQAATDDDTKNLSEVNELSGCSGERGGDGMMEMKAYMYLRNITFTYLLFSP